jgi:predicted transcriptional regulator
LKESSFTTALIGVFIFFNASREYQWVKRESILSKYLVEHVYRSHFTPLFSHEPIKKAQELMLRQGERSFIVFDISMFPIGTLSEWQVGRAAKKQELDRPISEFFLPKIKFVQPEENLKAAYQMLMQNSGGILVVEKEGVIAGILDNSIIDNIYALHR